MRICIEVKTGLKHQEYATACVRLFNNEITLSFYKPDGSTKYGCTSTEIKGTDFLDVVKEITPYLESINKDYTYLIPEVLQCISELLKMTVKNTD